MSGLHAAFEEIRFVRGPKRAMGQKLGVKKSNFWRSRSLPRPALLSCPLDSPLRRVALHDAMRALSCAPHAIAATFEDTAAALAQERRGADDATMGGRVGGILSICGPEVSPRPPRVHTRRGQSPTPHARALPAVDTSAKMHLKPDVYSTKCQGFGSRALWGAPSTGACGVGDYPTPDLSRRESRSRSAPEKSK